jgi:hypothetical protein
MAYKGGISYIDVLFDSPGWSNAVKCFPDIPSKLELQAPVREFLHCVIKPRDQTTKCAIFAKGDERGWLKFDVEDMTDIQRLKCIVVGRAYEWRERKRWRGADADEQAHYVYIILSYGRTTSLNHLK